ncbi:sirohydrochlorin chelatase [Microcoleus sp. FACHB-1515]|uniref:sirohydrochlorin chelatase n=1 Tax=Cyanophyceae TaxID=3028117 RepID=UPI00168255D4|nr:CbiX/SirB N-terminal domain-containing protein [Microcoleus sp. FACHB-1515]MBD2089866.1 sirohydrochlorin chelatase [Microcoleus sp. FACHB-1515]
MNSPSAYLLVSHGSRDRRPQIAVEALAQLLRDAWPQPARSTASAHGAIALLSPPVTPWIATAALELAPQPLHEQIQHAAQQAFAQGYRRLVILPLFLLAGVHVRVDLPAEVKLAQQALGDAIRYGSASLAAQRSRNGIASLRNGIDLHLCPHLGSHAGLEALLAQTFAEFPQATARILLAHGSRRTPANRQIASLADRLQAVPAYWSVAPSLSDRIAERVAAGDREIAIVPYFLFAGGITDAIAQSVQELSTQFPDCKLHLAAPLGATRQLAEIAIDLLTS